MTSDTDGWPRRIAACLEMIDAWHTRTSSTEEPEPGSRLAGDDARNRAFPASMVAWSSIGTAVDHLGLASDSLQRQGGAMLRPGAFYTVCRAALVAASQAIWVMTGTREVRGRRLRLLELEEANSHAQLLQDYAHDDQLEQDTSPEFFTEVREKATAARDRARRLRTEIRPARGEYSVTKTLQDAAVEMSDDLSDPWLRRAYLFEWRAASGEAHARLWQKQLRPGHTVPLLGPERGVLRYTTGSVEAYGQALAAATLATQHALALWDQQRHSSH